MIQLVNLNKIELTKKGQSINLTKTTQSLGEILVNLNWNQHTQPKKAGFLSSLLGKTQSDIDLDLGCLYELTDGSVGCVQALGNAFGNLQQPPYVELDGDDRTGTVSTGENLRINGNQLPAIKRVLVYAFIYEGVTNWSQADGVVTLTYNTGPSIEVKLTNAVNHNAMCAIAMIENDNNQTFKVERLVEYFSGHRDMDRAYSFGLQWQAGRK